MIDMIEKPTKPKREFHVYQGKDKQWYWHAKSVANKKVTFQGEAHPTKYKATAAIKREWKALGIPGEPVIKYEEHTDRKV